MINRILILLHLYRCSKMVYDTHSECCEPCLFCHDNILIQNVIQAFCVFYLYTVHTIGLPRLWDTVLPKKNCHITPLPPHNGYLYTTAT